MIKYERLPGDILDRISRVPDYFSGRPEVVFAYLFGSLGAGKQAPLSDVDIAVFLSSEGDPAPLKLSLFGDLSKLLDTGEIDLVVLNTAPLPLKARIIRQGALLVDKDPFRRHKFESLTLREHFDFEVLEKTILEQRYSLGG